MWNWVERPSFIFLFYFFCISWFDDFFYSFIYLFFCLHTYMTENHMIINSIPTIILSTEQNNPISLKKIQFLRKHQCYWYEGKIYYYLIYFAGSWFMNCVARTRTPALGTVLGIALTTGTKKNFSQPLSIAFSTPWTVAAVILTHDIAFDIPQHHKDFLPTLMDTMGLTLLPDMKSLILSSPLLAQ